MHDYNWYKYIYILLLSWRENFQLIDDSFVARDDGEPWPLWPGPDGGTIPLIITRRLLWILSLLIFQLFFSMGKIFVPWVMAEKVSFVDINMKISIKMGIKESLWTILAMRTWIRRRNVCFVMYGRICIYIYIMMVKQFTKIKSDYKK